MQLEQKYELLEAVGELVGTQDQTIPAWERSSGKLVFVHLLAGGYNGEVNAILTAVGRLPPENRQRVLGAGDYSGTAYVITDALPWGVTLRNWITNMSPKVETPAAPPAPTIPVTVEAPPAARNAAELTRAGTWKIPAFDSAVKSEPVAPRQPEPPPPAPPPKLDPVVTQPMAINAGAVVPEKEPGEFTRLMRAGMAEPAASLEMPKPAPGGSAAEERDTGEFTQMLRAVKPDPMATAQIPGAPTAAPAAADAKPGEFTQLLRAFKRESPSAPVLPVPGSATPPVRSADQIIPPIDAPPKPMVTARQEIPDVPMTPARAAESSPGDFTNWLQQPVGGPSPKPSAPPPPPPVEAAWQFDPPAAPAPPPIQPAPAAKQGPGAFTQMFQTPRTPAPAAPAAPPISHEEGGFTQLLRAPASPAGGIFEPPRPGGPADADLFKTPGQGASNVAGGPSFTQFMAVSTPTPPAAPAAAPPAPAPAPKEPPLDKPRSYLPLILILGVLFLLTVALVLVLWLR